MDLEYQAILEAIFSSFPDIVVGKHSTLGGSAFNHEFTPEFTIMHFPLGRDQIAHWHRYFSYFNGQILHVQHSRRREWHEFDLADPDSVKKVSDFILSNPWKNGRS